MGEVGLTEEHRELAVDLRRRIVALEQTLREEIASGRLVEFDCKAPVKHDFAPGAYGRTMAIPAGTLIVGKIHKHAHLNVLAQGDLLVLTESGGLERLVGPLTMVSPAGTKRAVYTLTDSVWVTFHVTDETDIEKAEAYLATESFEEYEEFIQLERQKMKQIEVTA